MRSEEIRQRLGQEDILDVIYMEKAGELEV